MLSTTKYTPANNSSEPMKTTIKFEIETSDEVSLKLKKSFSKFFSTRSQSDDDYQKAIKVESTESGWGVLFGAIDSTTVHRIRKSEAFESSTVTDNGQEIYSLRSKSENFEFSCEIVIPGHSMLTFDAFSKPIQGVIPFTAIYELVPTGSMESNNGKVLELTLRKYGMDQKIVGTSRGTLLVHYEGFMHVDAGHKIEVNVQTTMLEHFTNLSSCTPGILESWLIISVFILMVHSQSFV